ncbi:hypothetical protein GW7_14699 [Heterocephalus glaber]|uniref:Uncharacterized protein n=1 Tax=Heterocephalus glaber TaxID=10181 RepID=G5BSB6_HETGA|nr:hypothetical protein GW7_14699 [Heterocephalus glaber]
MGGGTADCVCGCTGYLTLGESPKRRYSRAAGREEPGILKPCQVLALCMRKLRTRRMGGGTADCVCGCTGYLTLGESPKRRYSRAAVREEPGILKPCQVLALCMRKLRTRIEVVQAPP